MNQFAHLVNVVLGRETPRSQVTEPELRLLQTLVREAQVTVELGCFEGRTANALAQSTDGDVFTIDRFPRGRSGVSCSEWIARWGRLRAGSRNLTILRGATDAIADGFDRPVDLLFIDADHSFDGVRRDWQAWAPKVRPGGVIILHDCRQTPNHPRYHGSAKFYEEVLKNDDAIEEIDGVESLAVFRKKAAVPPLSRIELTVNPPFQPGRAA